MTIFFFSFYLFFDVLARYTNMGKGPPGIFSSTGMVSVRVSAYDSHKLKTFFVFLIIIFLYIVIRV